MSDSPTPVFRTLSEKEFAVRMKEADGMAIEVRSLLAEMESVLTPVSQHLLGEIAKLKEFEVNDEARAILAKILALPQELFRIELTMALIQRVGQKIMQAAK